MLQNINAQMRGMMQGCLEQDLQVACPVVHEAAAAKSYACLGPHIIGRKKASPKPVPKCVCLVLPVAKMRIAHDRNLR